MEKAALSEAERTAKFREGVDALFVVWSALAAMREASVAGHETSEAIDDLFEGVVEQFVFGRKPKVTQSDLEDMIFDFTSRELCTELEDGSVEQVADYAFKLFRTLSDNDLSVYERVMLAASRRRKAAPQRVVVVKEKASGGGNSNAPEKVEGAEGSDDGADDDDADDDDGESEERSGDKDGEAATAAAAADDDEKKFVDAEEDDADGGGWTVVGSKKK